MYVVTLLGIIHKLDLLFFKYFQTTFVKMAIARRLKTNTFARRNTLTFCFAVISLDADVPVINTVVAVVIVAFVPISRDADVLGINIVVAVVIVAIAVALHKEYKKKRHSTTKK